MNDSWQKLLDLYQGDAKENIPTSTLTTLEIGGEAKVFIPAYNSTELKTAVKTAKEFNLPFLVIGGGSNLLVSDEPLDLLIVKDNSNRITQEEEITKVLSGTPLENLIHFTIDQGLTGVQRMIGIPGSVGGAVYGNAGAYGQTISDYLEKVICFDPSITSSSSPVIPTSTSVMPNPFPVIPTSHLSSSGSSHVISNEVRDLKILSKNECNFSYRDSDFKKMV